MRFLCALCATVGLLVIGASPALARTDGSTPAPTSITRLVTHVPLKTLNEVGKGKLWRQFTVKSLSGSPYKVDGKPDVLAGELAWCPHCEADSWALAIALSRFGRLSHLRIIDSGTYYGAHYHANPSFPDTNGLSFLRAGYRSRYLSFSNVVLQDVQGRNLQRPTKRQQAAFQPFDPMGEFPATDVGGDWGFLNSGYSPGIFAGKTWSQIAGSLADPRSRIAQRVDGMANLFTAAMCDATAGKPASVCRSKGVRAAGKAHLAPYPIAQ